MWRRGAIPAPPPVAERKPRPAVSPTVRRPRPTVRRARPAVRLGCTSAGRASGPRMARKGSVTTSRTRMARIVTGKCGEAFCTHCTSSSCWMSFQIHMPRHMTTVLSAMTTTLSSSTVPAPRTVRRRRRNSRTCASSTSSTPVTSGLSAAACVRRARASASAAPASTTTRPTTDTWRVSSKEPRSRVMVVETASCRTSPCPSRCGTSSSRKGKQLPSTATRSRRPPSGCAQPCTASRARRARRRSEPGGTSVGGRKARRIVST
eukprot:scaffold40_cov66-Phaeocystis_antarctica.AAC.16